jgi:hypothetical protein
LDSSNRVTQCFQHEKQTCNIELRHLYKRIYFNPGFFKDAGSNGKVRYNVFINSGLKIKASL